MVESSAQTKVETMVGSWARMKAVQMVDCLAQMKALQMAHYLVIATAVQMETGRLEEDTEIDLVPPLRKKTRLAY